MKNKKCVKRTKWGNTYDKTLKAIKKAILANPDLEISRNSKIKFEMAVDLACYLEGKSIINFSLVDRSGRDEDWWTQCEYYSKKLDKTIIWDSDFDDNFESLNDFADCLARVEANIEEFEDNLEVKNKL